MHINKTSLVVEPLNCSVTPFYSLIRQVPQNTIF